MTSTPTPDDLDEVFTCLESGLPPPGASAVRGGDPVARVENGALFRQMAVAHAKPLKSFAQELRRGEGSSRWLEIVRPIVSNLLKAATELEQNELTDALLEMASAIDAAARVERVLIEGPQRDRLLVAYRRLSALLPIAFEITPRQDQREPLLVHNLLSQVPGVHKLSIDKLYAAGISTLAALRACSALDLAHLGQLDVSCAQEISRLAEHYVREQREQVVDGEQGRWHARRQLRILLGKLRQAQHMFERADADFDREMKRAARQERNRFSLQINMILLQLGQFELVEHLERAATRERIAQVDDYIERTEGLPGAAQERGHEAAEPC